jgi:beta-N-acetylhexosaminidase
MPASLSRYFIEDILRKKIGFKGLVITDDLMMNGAVIPAGSVSNAVRLALEAGNDVVMLNNSQKNEEKNIAQAEAVWKKTTEAMQDDPEFRSRVREAAKHVLETKLAWLKGKRAIKIVPDVKLAETGVPNTKGTAFFQGLAARSITIVHDKGHVLPLSRENSGEMLQAGQNLDFFAAGKKAFPGDKEKNIPRISSMWYDAHAAGFMDDLRAQVDKAKIIIFYLEDDDGLDVLNDIRPMIQNTDKKLIIFSVLNPTYLEAASWADAAIAVYSESPESFTAGFSVLTGKIPAGGTLPFSYSRR